MAGKHTDIDSFTLTLAASFSSVVYLIYSSVINPIILSALNGLLKVNEVKLYANSAEWGVKYKFTALLLLYVFYFLFLTSREQKANVSKIKGVKPITYIITAGLLAYTLGCYYIFPVRVLSLTNINPISLTTTICIIAIFILMPKIATAYKQKHSLKTDKNLVFDFDRKKQSAPDNTIFSLATNEGWVNYPNIFQGFFGSGGAGSGKSVSLIEPFMWQMAEKNMCGLIFDFKNWELTSQMLAYVEYHQRQRKQKNIKTLIDKELEIRIVDFLNPKCSHRVNFLQPRIIDNLIKVDSIIKKFLKALSPADAEKKDIWFNGSVALFKGGLLFFKKHFPDYCTFPHILTFLTMIETETIKTLFESDEDVTMVSDVYMKAPDKTAGSIAASLSSSLSQLVDPNIFWVLSGDDINFALNDKDEPTLLFLITDEEFAQSLSPLASIIAMTCLNAMNKKGRYPSLAMFDEFPQIFLDDIDRLPATCRSNKVGIMCVIQDMSQLIKEYGDKLTKALCANLLNKIYFKATDKDTQQDMSNLMGEVEKIQESQSRGERKDSASSNFSVTKEKYLPPEDILNFQEGEGVGVKSTGKKERRYHARFKTLFRLYSGKKHIPNTGYPGIPEMSEVIKNGKEPIEFNSEITEDIVNANYKQIKEDVKSLVEAKLKELNPEEDEIADRVSETFTDADVPTPHEFNE